MNDDFGINDREKDANIPENDVYVRMSKRRAELGLDNPDLQAKPEERANQESAVKPEAVIISELPISESVVRNNDNSTQVAETGSLNEKSPMDKAIEEFESARDRRAESLKSRNTVGNGYRSAERGASYNNHGIREGIPDRGVYSSYRYDDSIPERQQEPSSFYAGNAGVNTPDVPPVSMNGKPPKPPKKKKEGNSNSFGRKFLLTIILGIVFGITVGATLYILNESNIKLPFAITGNSDTVADDEEVIIKETPTARVEDDSEAKDTEKDADDTNVDKSDTDDVVDSTEIDETIVERQLLDVSEVVQNVMPSVVSITGEYTVRQRDFWGQVYEQQSSGSGSGIIIGQNEQYLLIATNNHVVEDADELSVQFIDGTEAEARIKGTDEKIDLAVIIVSISDLTTSTKNAISVAVLGDSDALRVGEPAIAIGNALGYGQSVTTGVISAVNRRLEMQDGTVAEGLIQTDAAINPGNSGGALLNAYGEVIGINSSKIGGTTVDGVGFAIPISSAEPILSDIVLSDERVKVASGREGYLGIGGVTVTEEASQMYGIPVGVVVRQVYEGTGAEKAGLLQGDVIVSIGRKSVKSMEALKEELTYYEAGEVVSVEIYRNVDGTYASETVSVELVSEGDLKD